VTDTVVVSELSAGIAALIGEVRDGPPTAGQDAVLCLLEAVQLLLPTLDPAADSPGPNGLDSVRQCLRAASTSLRSHLWEQHGEGSQP
jgi:hypothetical protein